MARPKKQTVDYFPHSCVHKKTMFIVEQRYGNDGYAFWFKLLEMLGITEGHALDLKDEASWQFLQATTRLDEEKCTEILDLLSKLKAIDSELWHSEKVVWSDNFMEGIGDVYLKRTVDLPQKPGFSERKHNDSGVSGDGNPQSKVKESKGNNSIEKTVQPHRKIDHLSISVEEHQKLVDQYGETDVDGIYEEIENYKHNTKYKSLYLTANQWLKRRKESPIKEPAKTSTRKPNAFDIPDEYSKKGKYTNDELEKILLGRKKGS